MANSSRPRAILTVLLGTIVTIGALFAIWCFETNAGGFLD